MNNDKTNSQATNRENVPLKSEEEIELEALAKNDPDGAVHLTAPMATEQNKLLNPDDAVHTTVTQHIFENSLNSHVDPDEVVHGQ